jgi:hypothetical protein
MVPLMDTSSSSPVMRNEIEPLPSSPILPPWFQIIEDRSDAAGDAALHVDCAAAVDKAVLHVARERAMAPGGLIAWWHHVGVAGEGDVRRAVPEPCVEIVDIGRAWLAEGDAMNIKAGALQEVFQNAERAGVSRGYRGAADEIANNRKGIGHAPA